MGVTFAALRLIGCHIQNFLILNLHSRPCSGNALYLCYYFTIRAVGTDEPMAGQNNSGRNSLDENNDSIISSNIIFRGSVLRQIEEKRKPRKYIYICSQKEDLRDVRTDSGLFLNEQ